MNTITTADEVLAMAIDLERTGKEFYEALALGCGNRPMGLLCAQLARAEAGHATVFQEMRRHLQQSGGALPISEQQAADAHALVKGAVLPTPGAVRAVVLSGRVDRAVVMAIGMEEDGIRFYQRMLGGLPADQGSLVRQIMREEESHIRDLRALLTPQSG